MFLTFRTIFVQNMFSPCSAKRRASDKDLPVIMEDLHLLLTTIDQDQWPGVNSDHQRVNPEIIDLLQINNLTGPSEKSITAPIKINAFLIMEDLHLLLTPIDHDQWPGVNSDLQQVNPEIIDLYLVNLQIIDLHLANSEIIDLQPASVIQINR